MPDVDVCARRSVCSEKLTTVCVKKVFLTHPTALLLVETQLRCAPEGPVAGRGWPLFRRLSRSVQGYTTGSEGGRCWFAQMACVRACVRARVL